MGKNIGGQIGIYIDAQEACDYVRKKLQGTLHAIPPVIRTAINKTAKEAKKQDERITKRMYTAKGDIHALKFEKASTGNLQAILRDKGPNISISHFKPRVGVRGITVTINTAHGSRLLHNKSGKKAFFPGTINGARYGKRITKKSKIKGFLNGGGHGVMGRLGNPRLPIEKMASISSPVMHGNDQTWGSIEGEVLEMFYRNVDKEIERILGQ